MGSSYSANHRRNTTPTATTSARPVNAAMIHGAAPAYPIAATAPTTAPTPITAVMRWAESGALRAEWMVAAWCMA